MAQGCDGHGLNINEINLEEDEQVESSAGGIIEQSTQWNLPPGPPEENKLKIETKPVELVMEAIIPKGITVLLYSAGGAGKSTLKTQLTNV